MKTHSSEKLVVENPDRVVVKYADGEMNSSFDNDVTEVVLEQYER